MGSPLRMSLERRLYLTEQLSVGTSQSLDRLTKHIDDLMTTQKQITKDLEILRNDNGVMTKRISEIEKMTEDRQENVDRVYLDTNNKTVTPSSPPPPPLHAESIPRSKKNPKKDIMQNERKNWGPIPSDQDDIIKNHRLRTIV